LPQVNVSVNLKTTALKFQFSNFNFQLIFNTQ